MEDVKITKGTIIRTILMVIVLTNLVLKAFGKSAITVDDGVIANVVETVIEIAAIAVGFWKNNSYSEKALKADKFLQDLRNEEESEEV